jgi:hypothetical protein
MYTQFIFQALFIACTAVVYSCALTQPGEIFAKWHDFIYNATGVEKRITEGKPMPALYKVLVFCEKCISGQMALWIFLIQNFSFYRLGIWTIIVQHILFIGFTIFLSIVVKFIYNKIV